MHRSPLMTCLVWAFVAAAPAWATPETYIGGSPPAMSDNSRATFEFSSDEPGTFECSLDGVPFAACTNPRVYIGLPNGIHTLQVRAVDTDSNPDPTPASFTWTVRALATFELVHTFTQAEGQGPYAGVTLGTDGKYYGTTGAYGPSGWGAVYRVDESGNLEIVAPFPACAGARPDALIQAKDGRFYGVLDSGQVCGGGPAGIVFSVDVSGDFVLLHGFDNYADFARNGKLLEGGDGWLYGTDFFGPGAGTGFIYRIDSLGTFEIIHYFADVTPGSGGPRAALIKASDGYFYGTSFCGGFQGHEGNCGLGYVYRIDHDGNLTVVHPFAEDLSEGEYSRGHLIETSPGVFYGTTTYAGAYGAGTFFRMDAGGALTVLYSFSQFTSWNLMRANDGYFYGVSSYASSGTVFRLDSDGNYTQLYVLNGPDEGAAPLDVELIEGNDGKLYGTTGGGGAAAGGTIFRLKINDLCAGITCAASDLCHEAGTCRGSTGTCSNPAKPDGTGCNDGSACTQVDTCQAGTCVGTDPVVCAASDACHVAGVCDTGTGVCSNPSKPDGSACDDGNPCTIPDTCVAGACTAGPLKDTDGDQHVDAVCGGDDCNDADSGAWHVPGEVTHLTIANVSPANLAWDDQRPSVGAGTTYDLVSGSFGPGTGIAFGGAGCLESAGPELYSDARPHPPNGEGYWYLARARNSCGLGTYGTAARDGGIAPCP